MPKTDAALAEDCAVCGVPFSGALGALVGLFGVGRSRRTPNACTRCNTHIEEGRLVEMTVLFADLSSFTELTQKLGASSTHGVVDAFLRHASSILGKHGAFIDKYIGDAVMAVFNVPIKASDHAARALAAAIELQESMPGLAQNLGLPLAAGVGISTGFAHVGRLGSDDIKDYTAVGDVVNLAARLEGAARGGEIIVAGAAGEHHGAAPESLSLKGFKEPVAAYRLRASSGPAPLAPLPMRRKHLAWGPVLLALSGSGCGAITVGVPLALALGSSSLAAFLRALDRSPLRFPLLLLAVLMAAANLAILWRDRSALGATRLERRRFAVAAASAAVSALLVLAELQTHFHSKHVLF